MRASDSDRERVAEVVRAAAVEGRLDMVELDERLAAAFAARTYAQLAAVTADLPDDPGLGTADGPALPRRLPLRVPAATGRVLPADPDRPRNGAAVAVCSGTTRRGHWTVPEHLAAVAVMGGVELDLREADLAGPEVVITAVALCGGIEIIVPDGITVRADGIGILGGFDSPGAHEAGAGAPVVIVRGVAICGGVEVKRKGPSRRALRGSDGRRDELEPGPGASHE